MKARLLCTSFLCAAAISQVPAWASDTVTYTYDELGRLVGTTTSGGPNNSTAIGTCFDPAGNRTRYDVAISAPAPAPCPTPAPVPSPPPPPPPPPNQPPIAGPDTVNIICYSSTIINPLWNDYDLDNNVPLTIVSITRVSGTATAVFTTAPSVLVTTAANGTSVFSYTLRDDLGATSIGTITVNSQGSTSFCNGRKP